MNLIHQSLKDNATRQGFEDYVKGLTLKDNPYQRATKPFDWWSKGWHNAHSYSRPA